MKRLYACTLAALAAAVAGCSSSSSEEGPAPLTVAKAQCGAADRPETGLQGQVPAAMRAAGFNGFSCNLELAGQNRGDGGNWQATQFRDKSGRKCAYHGTAATTDARSQVGVRVLDVTTPRRRECRTDPSRRAPERVLVAEGLPQLTRSGRRP
jgi:hypothetical protein